MDLNKVFQPRPEDVIEKWVVVDAANQVVGRLATQIANLIRGKHTVCVMPHVKTGVRVVVVNAEKIIMTGNKMTEKEYWHYTGWRGNKKNYTSKDLFNKNPEHILYHAVKGMMRKCRMDNQLLDSHLKVYKGSTHPHAAQITAA